MINISEIDFVSAEQPSAAQTTPANNPGPQPLQPPPAPAQTDPITQLKSHPQEEIDWACGLDATMTGEQAIAEIKSRLGIDLRWPTTYSRFLQWWHKMQRKSYMAARLDDFRQLDHESNLSAGAATLQSANAVLFLQQAFFGSAA